MTPRTDIRDRIDAALEKMAWREMEVRAIYLTEADRAGLIHSEVTQHIHRDEQNVFCRALLYNLGERASRIILASATARLAA